MQPPVIVIGTRNRKKLDELVELLDLDGLHFATLAERPRIPDVVEDGDTFSANAAKKASETARALGEWALGEDSGLCVDALGGGPGILSARYSGEPTDDASNNRKLLEELGRTPLERRTAHYVCSIALADPSGRILATAEGECHGRIGFEERGSNGFGYDPLFLYGEGELTFGELPAEFKRMRSHRAAAVKLLRPQLIEQFQLRERS